MLGYIYKVIGRAELILLNSLINKRSSPGSARPIKMANKGRDKKKLPTPTTVLDDLDVDSLPSLENAIVQKKRGIGSSAVPDPRLPVLSSDTSYNASFYPRTPPR